MSTNSGSDGLALIILIILFWNFDDNDKDLYDVIYETLDVPHKGGADG